MDLAIFTSLYSFLDFRKFPIELASKNFECSFLTAFHRTEIFGFSSFEIFLEFSPFFQFLEHHNYGNYQIVIVFFALKNRYKTTSIYISPLKVASFIGCRTECRQTKCRQTKCRTDKMSTIFFYFFLIFFLHFFSKNKKFASFFCSYVVSELARFARGRIEDSSFNRFALNGILELPATLFLP